MRNFRKILHIISLFVFVCFVFLFVGRIIYSKVGSKTKEEGGNKEGKTGEAVVLPSVPIDNSILSSVSGDEFQVHFLELGNEYNGDCVYIKAGETDILIDAGSRYESAGTISGYLRNFCTDGVIEYVIATHAHQDHISGFLGNKTGKTRNGIFYQFKIDTLIQFSFSDLTSSLYKYNYLNSLEELKTKGTKIYTAGECWNETNGAKRTFQLSDSSSMDILYNYYYFNSAKNTVGGENNYSVCTMFNYQKDNTTRHIMLTGDLEKEGETKLAEYYDGSSLEKTLPHCDLFKAGHHGSSTSSNEILLSKITPDVVCVCCCAGSTEYTVNYRGSFPTQDFVDRISKYTDRVFVTSRFDEKELKYKSMNGNIIVSFKSDDMKVICSNNGIILKDSEWFNQKVYVVPVTSNGITVKNIADGKRGSTDYFDVDSKGSIEVVRRTWSGV